MKYFFKSLGYVFGRFVLNKKFMTAYSPKYDIRLRFRTPDGGGRAIYKKGLYEERMTNFIVHTIKPEDGDVLLDVGANIGWYSILMAKTFPQARIHCFEPDTENYDVLTRNIERNGITQVTANQLGVGAKSETKKLYLYKKSNIGRHSMLDINDGPSIDVKVIALDEYFLEKGIDIQKVKFLKIDIEGFEYFAFQGAEKLLGSIPILLAEFSPGYMRKGGVEPEDLLDLMQSHGYKPYVVNGLDLVPIDRDELLGRDSNINLIWKKG